MALFTEIQNDKIKVIKRNSDELLNLVNEHCTLLNTHLSKVNLNNNNIDLKKNMVKKINREDIQSKNYDIDILKFDYTEDKIEIIDTIIPDINIEKYKNLDVYYFYEKEYIIINSIKLKINSIKNSIENHTLLENTHLDKDILEGKKQLEFYDNKILSLNEELNKLTELNLYIDKILELFKLELEKYTFLFNFHTNEYKSHYQ